MFEKEIVVWVHVIQLDEHGSHYGSPLIGSVLLVRLDGLIDAVGSPLL